MIRRKSQTRKNRGTTHSQRVSSSILEKVKKVGPEKFGIVLADPHKKRTAVTMTNYYGDVLFEAERFLQTRVGIYSIIERVEKTVKEFGIEDLVFGIEWSGRFHRSLQKAVKEKQYEVVLIHPFTTKQMRQNNNAGIKTDKTDLDAMSRALMAGYFLQEQDLSDLYHEWRRYNRAREDSVRRMSIIKTQMIDRLEGFMPGYEGAVGNIWKSPGSLFLAEHYGSAEALLKAGGSCLSSCLKKAKLVMQASTRMKILVWSANAPGADPAPEVNQDIFSRELKMLRRIEKSIEQYERDLVKYLVQTPYVQLLAMKGINVVCASGYGAEVGPMSLYLNSGKITGRAGLYGSCSLSDGAGFKNGHLVGRRNARIRDAIMEVAYCLTQHNPHFKARAKMRQQQGWSSKRIHVEIGSKFTRLSYWIVAGQKGFDHPSMESREAVLRKLYEFAKEHDISTEETQSLLECASRQLPKGFHNEEGEALKKLLPKRKRKSKAALISDILPNVIEQLTTRTENEKESTTMNS